MSEALWHVAPALAALVFAAFAVETAAGFGSTLIALSLGAQLLPLEELLAIVIPVNLLLSARVALRDRDAVAWRVLGASVAPAMGLGMALAFGLWGEPAGPALVRAFAAFVVTLAAWELWRARDVKAQTQTQSQAELGPWAARAWLLGAGVAHALFAASGPIVVDGKLDDAAWTKAVSTGPFGSSFNGAPVHSETTAKLLYDDEFLYVAFDCHDEDVWGTLLKKDDPIYGEEVVEIFLDADGDGRTYNELEVSPHNTQFDAAFEERRKDLDKAILWDSGMESAVQVQGTIDNPSDVDRGWTVEMKIPLKNLYAVPHLPPKPGDTWRFNLYRLDYHSGRKVNEGQAYSPLYLGDFHNLPRFAYLKFQ